MRYKTLKKICFLLIITLALMSLISCGSKPPELDAVKDELITLIEDSAEINDIIFGEGLSVYPRDGDEEETVVYIGMVESLDDYEMVRSDSKYLTVEQIKEAAEKVYSADYLDSVYDMAFVGYADETIGVVAARYYEYDGWIYKSMSSLPLTTGARNYDFDTIKIVKPSKADYINFTVDTEKDGEKLTITLSALLTDDGWRLDSPTY